MHRWVIKQVGEGGRGGLLPFQEKEGERRKGEGDVFPIKGSICTRSTHRPEEAAGTVDCLLWFSSRMGDTAKVTLVPCDYCNTDQSWSWQKTSTHQCPLPTRLFPVWPHLSCSTYIHLLVRGSMYHFSLWNNLSHRSLLNAVTGQWLISWVVIHLPSPDVCMDPRGWRHGWVGGWMEG